VKLYETPKRSLDTGEIEEEEGARYIPEKQVTGFSTKILVQFLVLLFSYAYRKRNLDKDFGIRRDVDGTFRIGNSIIDIDQNTNVHVQGKLYKGTRGLFELLTRKN
jgi:hypothetical protein